MIHQLVQPLSDIITGLPYVGRYGGIVKNATRTVQIGMTDQGMPIFDLERFPVSCTVNGEDCFSSGRYLDLVPNDNFSSIFYLEEISGLNYDGVETRLRNKAFHKFSSRLRLVGWLNLPKLGITDCNGSSLIVGGLMKLLNRQYANLDVPMPIHQLEYRVLTQEPKQANPFEKYTYGEEQMPLWMYPFDYFSLVIDVRTILHESCLEEFEPDVAIDCVVV